ncbi:hypothetical protein HDU84_002525 [Entophlyctis sp. JEL0112]|nr:hypothetical protein HDU84_002525 [Entophlyctis sp. JEL0112]
MDSTAAAAMRAVLSQARPFAERVLAPVQTAAPAPASVPSQPDGTYLPGTPIALNGYTVTVERYLAQGAFAHVYLVVLHTGQRAVLKRTLCPDSESFAALQNEIQVMKLLAGHPCIVSFYDSSSVKKAGGFEVFILMENCDGGSLMDHMNTRLVDRLVEPEILGIFLDIVKGVFHMHYTASPGSPILHRDLKIENVLLGSDGHYKLCDFGSATTRTVPPGVQLDIREVRRLEDDIEKVTTVQYRAPELCDLYVRRGIGVGVDVWALGVLLYKLCYYTTPFEEKGKLAILNGRYETPSYPSYSHSMTQLIGRMLTVDPSARISLYDVYETVCFLIGSPVELSRPISASQTSQPPQSQTAATSRVAAAQSPLPLQQKPVIVPMRRGRPGAASRPVSEATAQLAFSSDPWSVTPAAPAQAGPSGVRDPWTLPAAAAAPSDPWAAAGWNANFDGDGVDDAGDNEDDDDDDATVGIVGAGGRGGSEKYAAYLKHSDDSRRGSIKEDANAVSNGFSKLKVSSFSNLKIAASKAEGGGSYFSTGSGNVREENGYGFVSIADDHDQKSEHVADSFEALASAQIIIPDGRVKSGLSWDASVPPATQSGWATVADFQLSAQGNDGWATDEAFASTFNQPSAIPSQAAGSPTPKLQTVAEPQPPNNSSGILASNAFILADKGLIVESAPRGQNTNSLASIIAAKRPPPSPPIKKPSSPALQEPPPKAPAQPLPPAKPARRKPLPETPAERPK